MESIGYVSVMILVSAAYAAIQQCRVEGHENPIDTIRAVRSHKVARNIMLTRNVYSSLPFVASEALRKRLSAGERELFQQAGWEAAATSRQLVREADEKNLVDMRSTQVSIVRLNFVAFRKAMSGVNDRAAKVYGADELKAILTYARGAENRLAP